MIDADLEPRVDRDPALVVALDAKLFQAQVVGVGTATHAHKEDVSLKLEIKDKLNLKRSK